MGHKIPLTVIGGFLGAGKTTLINHLLLDNRGVRYTVLVNDFGDLAIDESLIEAHDGETLALANGCICCSIGDDLIETLMEIVANDPPPEHLIIEASGVADPQAIADIGALDPNLERDLTIIVVDGGQIREQWNDKLLRDTVDRQLCSADLVVLNHADDLSPEEKKDVRNWLTEKTGGKPLTETPDGRLPSALFSSATAQGPEGAPHAHAHHGDVFRTETAKLRQGLDRQTLVQTLRALPPFVLRAKGFVDIEGSLVEVQKAGKRISLRPAEGKEAKAGPVIFIGTTTMPPLSQIPGLKDLLNSD